MSIFITGATGFVGRNFLEWLIRHVPDVPMTCLVRDPGKAKNQWAHIPDFENGRIQWLQGDLLEPAGYARQLLKAEWVFHIAALVGLRNGPEFYQANTETTRSLLTVLKDSSQLKRLVDVSSISAIDRPLNTVADSPLTEESPACPNTDYGKSKLQAEELVKQSGLPYSILRPPYIYGPYPRINSSMDRLIHDVQAQRHYTRFPFPGRASEIYVEDLAEMIWVASQHPAAENQVFFVANPHPVRIGEVYPKVAKALRVPHQGLSIPNHQIERIQRHLYRKQPENVLLRVMFEDFFHCSAEKWYRLTDFKLRYGFEEGLFRTVRWFQDNGLI
jgi:nucleoside-diphosphate-sugar epimerase